MVSSEPKPQACAMRFTGRLVSDSARCAASTRRRSTPLAGVSPVAAR